MIASRAAIASVQADSSTVANSINSFGLDLHRDLSAEQIAPQFAEQLVKEQAESIDRGMTLCGPHRDELRLNINGRDAGLYGSRGQARTGPSAARRPVSPRCRCR